jgi:hypothetical protein
MFQFRMWQYWSPFSYVFVICFVIIIIIIIIIIIFKSTEYVEVCISRWARYPGTFEVYRIPLINKINDILINQINPVCTCSACLSLNKISEVNKYFYIRREVSSVYNSMM